MDFTSYQFILGFLPLAFLAYALTNRFAGWNMAVNVLAAVSLLFYAMFGWKLFIILMMSIGMNFVLSTKLATTQDRVKAKRFLTIGLVANLILLGALKYVNFMIDIVNISGLGIDHFQLLASIGLSFYTFVQIGYLIDAYNGQLVSHSLARYIVFSAFFPCVTAGPLVLQKEMMEQLNKPKFEVFDTLRILAGITMFGIGMFKKVVLADSIAPFADKVFQGAAMGASIDFDMAWVGALCYTLQLYFDFSGYSDMALGIGTIFGLKLPLNFDSPFKATNISDFWRRWHMTMTRFFTNYIYSGLAINGMRKAMHTQATPFRKYLLTAFIPPVVTFLVAGVWHGAGWNFVVYGLVHGLAIAIYMAWSQFSSIRLPSIVAWTLTMLVVVNCLVIFRAPNMSVAWNLLSSMWSVGFFDPESHPAGLDYARAVSMIVIFGAVTLMLPNSQLILHYVWPSSDTKPENAAFEAGLLAWKPGLGNALVTGVGYALALTLIGSGTGFLYYQF